jgi:hypothetical protein
MEMGELKIAMEQLRQSGNFTNYVPAAAWAAF